MKKSPNIPPYEPTEEETYSRLEQDDAWVFSLFKFGLIWIVFIFIFLFAVIALSH